MSFRITGYGSRQQQERRNRAAAFKRTHKVGQICRGVLTRWQNPPYGWVTVDGHEMLAELQTTPETGQSLTFLVTQLEPQIILKELKDGEAPPLTTNDILRAYWTARDRLDSHLQTYCWPLLPVQLIRYFSSQAANGASASRLSDTAPTSDDSLGTNSPGNASSDSRSFSFTHEGHTPPDNASPDALLSPTVKKALHKHFAGHVATSTEATALYLQFAKAKFGMDMLLADTPYRLHYLPWWQPQARAVELLATHSEDLLDQPVKLTLGANYPYAGRILCQLLLHTSSSGDEQLLPAHGHDYSDSALTIGYRVFVEHRHILVPAEAVCRAFDAKAGAMHQDPSQFLLSCLGVSQLPSGIHDVISSILSGGSDTYSRRSSLNRKA